MNDAALLIDRAAKLLDRLENLLPPAVEAPDWNAHAFRWRRSGARGQLLAVAQPHRVDPDDLLCLGRQKEEVERNTRQEGSIQAPPDNLLIYATSNRRHLMPEFQRENREARNVDGEIHQGESVEEKISLSDRFGLWVSFHPFNQEQYLLIVHHWLRRLGGDLRDREASERAALQWALRRVSRSGRTAWQFARDWAGRFPS